MIVFNKEEIRNSLSLEDVFNLLYEFGGNPEYTTFGILSSTICHNRPEDGGSRKLYFYSNTGLFQCYSNCGYFDVFELVSKVMKIQKAEDYDLNDSVRWIARRFGISGHYENEDEDESLDDWKYLANYQRIQDIETKTLNVTLKEYDDKILGRFNYSALIKPWFDENISREVMQYNKIGYYPGGDQITIPHYDKAGRFIGLRGRTLSVEEGEKYGKYRPLKVNKQLYNHPLGFNLYGLNHSKNNIKLIKKAIVWEAEKSVLKYQSAFGIENDITVACCGSSLSAYQVQLLVESGAEEIIVAFDKQYEALNTDESKIWAKKLTQIYNKYKNDVLISFIWDKENLLRYKSSPIDEEIDKFLYLFKERIVL